MSDTNELRTMPNTILCRFLNVFLILFVGIPIFSLHAESELNITDFGHLSTMNGLPTNEVRRVYQDKDGYIWIATTSGLCQYDGYQVKVYRSNLYAPDLLTNNNVRCVSEDNEHHLWIGTNNGVNVMDKMTGQIRRLTDKRLYNNITLTILNTRKGVTLIGTDRGLFRYDAALDSCFLYPSTAVHSIQHLYEDSKGQIWVAANHDLFRYDIEKDRFYAYGFPSSTYICEDTKHRLWVGTFTSGLYLLENPYSKKPVQPKIFRHNASDKNCLGDDVIYAVSEDLNTGDLWIGTRSGLTILKNGEVNDPAFVNYAPDRFRSFSFNEVNAILRDRAGMMWLGMLGGGVSYIDTRRPMFFHDNLETVKHRFSSNAVRSMCVDDAGLLWLGIGSYGFVTKDLKSGRTVYYKDNPDFKGVGNLSTVTTIIQSKDCNRYWLGTFYDGVLLYDRKQHRVQRFTPSSKGWEWLPDARVYCVLEDSKGNCWFGTKAGIGVLTPDGKGYKLKGIPSDHYYSLAEDANGAIWAGSCNNGILKFIPKAGEVNFQKYACGNGKYNNMEVQCIYEDKRKRLWVGVDGGGLLLYDAATDKFVSVTSLLNIPGDGVLSIQEDNPGNLWLGTNVGLIKLIVPEDISRGNYRLYTTHDGLQGNVFLRNSSLKTKDGEIFIGGHNGYNSFYSERMRDYNMASPVCITDIKVFNHSWETLPLSEREAISSQMPQFTGNITLNHRQNNFSVEFASLSYADPMQIQYAYRLKGFEGKWQYVDASHRFAYYNNLKPGTYEFELKASNESGMWNDEVKSLEVTIQPPLWATWYAYVIYFLIGLGIAFVAYRTIRNRIRLKNELRLHELEQVKSEELNHAKLQFFTNITHELLTPLTIISAAVDELRNISPANNEYYQVMTVNINRLIRLLQQILEFRKAETGNLKLKVSKGDLALFVRNNVDSFRPLMQKKKMQFVLRCEPESFSAYFDSDKLDKILYNLLSNAAKYNCPGGMVQVELEQDKTGHYAYLSVKDNGKGMASEAVKNLFKRFYEGDYRKFNTIGTGIGLSLTKDLVELHGGTITVKSEPNKGTDFRVMIPIDREAYKEQQIDEDAVISSDPLLPTQPVEIPSIEKKGEEKVYSLLLVEDNEELLKLMVNLLSTDYNVYTAGTGVEGLEVLKAENIDIVVSDVMMPEMDGIEFCKQIKGSLETCHIPVILLTAKNQEEDRVEAYDSGADAFISKPFNLSVLHARISNLLRERERTGRNFKNQLVFETKELDYTSLDEEFMKRVVECVNNHLDDPNFDQTTLVEEIGSTRSTLYRKLKSLTGLTYSSFILNIRMKAACRIMEENKGVRISDLSYLVGFSDPKYFSSCFKKEFGMQPSEYVKRFVQEGEEKP